MEKELEYLRFANSFIGQDTKLFIDLLYQNQENTCAICKNINNNSNCGICKKKVCQNCIIECKERNLNFCMEHKELCAVCNKNCACDNCRIYFSDEICDACAEFHINPYHCGCYRKRKGKRENESICGICETKFNNITKQYL